MRCVRARLRLADRRRAGDPDRPVDRAARGEGRARDVEAHDGSRVRLLSFHCRQAVREQIAVIIGEVMENEMLYKKCAYRR